MKKKKVRGCIPVFIKLINEIIKLNQKLVSKMLNTRIQLASEHFIPLPRSVTDISLEKNFKNESHTKNTLESDINFIKSKETNEK